MPFLVAAGVGERKYNGGQLRRARDHTVSRHSVLRSAMFALPTLMWFDGHMRSTTLMPPRSGSPVSDSWTLGQMCSLPSREEQGYCLQCAHVCSVCTRAPVQKPGAHIRCPFPSLSALFLGSGLSLKLEATDWLDPGLQSSSCLPCW